MQRGEIAVDKIEDFWVLNDMFDFDNIGFTNTVEGKVKVSEQFMSPFVLRDC